MQELADSQSALQRLTGTPVTSFAMPYGEYDDRVMEQVKRFYRSARTTDYGFNMPSSLDPYQIHVRSVESSTTTATVRSWVDTAVKNRYWLVLVYHGIDDARGGVTRSAHLDVELAYIKSTGVRVATMSQALDELTPQVVP